jgi:hypothetical protein
MQKDLLYDFMTVLPYEHFSDIVNSSNYNKNVKINIYSVIG